MRGVSPQCNQFRHPSYLKYHKKTEQRLGTFAKYFFNFDWTALANIIFHPIFFRCCCIVLCIMPGYLCVLCVYVVADRGRCVQLWPLFPLPPVISETYPTVLSILARYWSAFIWCTVSSDTESNNIVLYEHWTYMTQCRILGKFEYTRGPIFKVVLEC